MRSQDDALSESATKDLLHLMMERGYFHRDVEPLLADKDSRDAHLFSNMDPECQLVSTHDGSIYMTKSRLGDLLAEELALRGKMSIENAAIVLAVNTHQIEEALMESKVTESIVRVADNLFARQYLDHLVENLDFGDRILVSELATVWDMPAEDTLQALEGRENLTTAKLVSISGTKALVTPRHQEVQRCRIRGAFRAITLPTQVDSVCQDFQWDVDHVLPILQDLCDAGSVQGEVHQSGGASLAGAMFVPSVYLSMQRTSIDEFFAANGFITVRECLERGVLESKMVEYVLESNPNGTPLPNSVILKEVVVSPLEQALTETMANDSFLDLSLHLPDSLMTYEQDIRTIVDDMSLPSEKREGSVTVTSHGEALFVSQGMIRHVVQTLLPPLIESFAKTRAEEIMQGVNDVEEEPHEPIVSKKQSSKRKSKKVAAKAKASASHSSVHFGCVPLVTVAKKLAHEYPDLADIQNSAGPLYDGDENAPVWDASGLEEDKGGGPLYDVCRSVVFNDEFQASCERAVEAELERLKSEQTSTSIRGRKDGATKIRSIETAFEDPACFNAACYFLQVLAKFLEYAAAAPDLDEKDLSCLKQDFLEGCCADFTSRITQYCLFRNEVEETLFSVERDALDEAEENMESSLPPYCQPMGSALRRYPKTRLCCSNHSDGSPRMPLPTLRETLPGTVGVTLARTWTLCGGRCYEGGIRLKADGVELARPGDLDGFLSHVDEGCLTMCGLPFKKLDKKSEKQFMFARRKALSEALEGAADARTVLELTIMLLFQQVKGLAVTGQYLTGPILGLLKKEKKMPEKVSQLLQRLADSIDSGSVPDEHMVALVKACGLSRDISKHTVE